MKKKINCKARLHDWDEEPPKAGTTKCRACGKAFGTNPPTWKPGRKPKDAPAAPAAPAASSSSSASSPTTEAAPAKAKPSGPDLTKLLARWNTSPAAAEPAAATPQPGPAAAAPPKNAATEKFCKYAAKPIADLTVAGCRKLHKWLGSEAPKPDLEWLNNFREATGEVLALYMPDAEAGPFTKCCTALAVINVDMWVRGTPIKETPVEVPATELAPVPAERPAPKLTVVKDPPAKESQTWRKPPAPPLAAGPVGAPSSGESDPSGLTFDSSQMNDFYGLGGSGSAPGAQPSA
jgi:hypothetical protein